MRQAETGTAVADVCRQLGISEATFYVWKKKYANLGATELRLLREENAKFNWLVSTVRQFSPVAVTQISPPG